jgi:hypothetical protein
MLDEVEVVSSEICLSVDALINVGYSVALYRSIPVAKALIFDEVTGKCVGTVTIRHPSSEPTCLLTRSGIGTNETNDPRSRELLRLFRAPRHRRHMLGVVLTLEMKLGGNQVAVIKRSHHHRLG